MKLVFVITEMHDIGGAQRHVLDLAGRLSSRGDDVTIVSGTAGVAAEEAQSHQGIRFIKLPALVRQISPILDVKAVYQLIRVLRSLSPDLVTCHSSKAGVIGRIASYIARIPVIFTAHGWAFTEGVPDKSRRFYLLIEKMLAPFSDRIVAVSDFDRSLALKNRVCSENRIVRVHNGVGPGLLPPTPTQKSNLSKVRLVMVARFSDQKDHATLLKALAQLPTRDWEMTFVGAGDSTEEEALASQLHIDRQVMFVGERSNVREKLYQSDVFCLITNWEGLPLSIIEAMECGLPIVASDVGGVSELVSDGKNGLLVPRADVEAVVAALTKLLESPSLRSMMAQASTEIYSQSFTFDSMFAKMDEIYWDAGR